MRRARRVMLLANIRYELRGKLALAILLRMIVPTLLIGFLFHRTITEPMRELASGLI